MKICGGQLGRVAKVLLCVAFATACAPTAVPLNALLRDGQSNELLALEAYQNQTLEVTGTSEEIGLKKFDYKVTKHSFTPMFGSYHGESHTGTVTEAHAFVTLTTGDPKLGRLVCWLESDERATAARLAPGSSVTLVGKFQEYARDEHGFIAVLNSCEFK